MNFKQNILSSKELVFIPLPMLLPKPSLESWMLWYHQLQHKGDLSLAVREQAAALVPSVHMKGVLSPQGATGDPTSPSLDFPCNHSNIFLSVAVKVGEVEE